MLDFRAYVRPPHVASTDAGIEPLLYPIDESDFIFALVLLTPWEWMQSQPNGAFVPPLTQKCLRH